MTKDCVEERYARFCHYICTDRLARLSLFKTVNLLSERLLYSHYLSMQCAKMRAFSMVDVTVLSTVIKSVVACLRRLTNWKCYSGRMEATPGCDPSSFSEFYAVLTSGRQLTPLHPPLMRRIDGSLKNLPLTKKHIFINHYVATRLNL